MLPSYCYWNTSITCATCGKRSKANYECCGQAFCSEACEREHVRADNESAHSYAEYDLKPEEEC